MLELIKVFPPFFLTALFLAIVPGQGVAMVLRQSIVGGKRPALYAVFAVAFIPQFVPKSFNLGLGIFILSIVQATASLSWYGSLILAVEKASVYLQRPGVRRALTAISALGILGLAIGLLFTKPR